MLDIEVIGELTARVRSGTGARAIGPPASRRAWSLLGWLAIHPGLHPRSEVAVRLWPGVERSSARQSLRSAVWSLRAVLDDGAPSALVTTRERIGLNDDVAVDLHRYAAARAGRRLREMCAFGDGDLLAGIDDPWAVIARDEHRRQMIAALAALADHTATRSHPAEAIPFARRAAALDPLSEVAGRALMTYEARAGDVAAALSTYQRLAARLRRDLHTPPSEPTRRLAERLLEESDPS